MSDIRVRTAPSPTGYFHIANMRQAVYCWLYARHNNGKFIVRIEDTDRTRFVEDAEEYMLESLRWLGVECDEGPTVGGPYAPYRQSERLELYQRYAKELVDKGLAYYCYCSSERLEEMRKEQEASKLPSRYDRRCRDLSAEDAQRISAEVSQPVVRLRMPTSGTITFHDLLRGEVQWDPSNLTDPVILKSDGFPTYHMAVVIDDHFMKISHVIRGEEWISSTPIHVTLYDAFGWEPPIFVHLPIIKSPTGKGKLSKRDGATAMLDYREMGYLPEALLNFMALLGWNPGGTEQEIYSKDELIQLFTLERLSTVNAAFSIDKLNWFNGIYIRKLDPIDLAQRCVPFLQKAGLLPVPCTNDQLQYIVSLMPLVQEKLKLLAEAPEKMELFLQEEIVLDPGVLTKIKGGSVLAENVLAAVRAGLASTDDFTFAGIEQCLRTVASDLGLEDGQVFMPIRVAISGKTVTPGIFETVSLLGKERVLSRLDQALRIYMEQNAE